MNGQLAIRSNNFLHGGLQSKVLTEEFREVQEYSDASRSITMRSRLLGVLEDLGEVYREGGKENWDGYGAKRVRYAAYLGADRFLRTLPSAVPLPEILLEPDGAIAFEWHKASNWVFSVSVENMNELSYAGLFGRSEICGKEFFRDEIPQAIIQSIARLVSSPD